MQTHCAQVTKYGSLRRKTDAHIVALPCSTTYSLANPRSAGPQYLHNGLSLHVMWVDSPVFESLCGAGNVGSIKASPGRTLINCGSPSSSTRTETAEGGPGCTPPANKLKLGHRFHRAHGPTPDLAVQFRWRGRGFG